MNKKYRNTIIVVAILLLLIILLLIFPKNEEKKNEQKEINGVSLNHTIDDENITFLYDRYHSEEGLKFNLVGSDIYDDYAFYYKKKKVNFDDFSNVYKNYILLDLMNYRSDYDQERKCYRYSLKEFKDIYFKYYGSLDGFNLNISEDYSPQIYVDNEVICISDNHGNSDYQKTIDTYMVNGIYDDDKIIIYERVAFVKVTDKKVEFYKDYKMKNKVYSLSKKDIDMSFIHSSDTVSNVLLKYQNKFPIYQYTYVKGSDTYYLESIEQ